MMFSKNNKKVPSLKIFVILFMFTACLVILAYSGTISQKIKKFINHGDKQAETADGEQKNRTVATGEDEERSAANAVQQITMLLGEAATALDGIREQKDILTNRFISDSRRLRYLNDNGNCEEGNPERSRCVELENNITMKSREIDQINKDIETLEPVIAEYRADLHSLQDYELLRKMRNDRSRLDRVMKVVTTIRREMKR